MAGALSVFISSTIEDFADVREDLAATLRRRGIQVLMSEENDFPVEPGVASHDACLAAIRSAHVFVLLVGTRFGGEYRREGKSITWREWEEATRCGLLTVLLVQRKANELARQIFVRRRELQAQHREASVPELDGLLRREFPDAKPERHNLPGVQRFIDAVRKGHVDNWVNEWNGEPYQALQIIDQRCQSALAAYQTERRQARELLEREQERAQAMALLAQAAAVSIAAGRPAPPIADAAALIVLEHCRKARRVLFGFMENEVFNFMLYRRAGETLEGGPRVAHPMIGSRRGRPWKVGQGHVGMSVREGDVLVAGDVRNTAGWIPNPDTEATDSRIYVSAISVPLRAAPGEPQGAFVVTSNRLDHFQDPNQLEVLTAVTIGRILTGVWFGGALEPAT